MFTLSNHYKYPHNAIVFDVTYILLEKQPTRSQCNLILIYLIFKPPTTSLGFNVGFSNIYFVFERFARLFNLVFTEIDLNRPVRLSKHDIRLFLVAAYDRQTRKRLLLGLRTSWPVNSYVCVRVVCRGYCRVVKNRARGRWSAPPRPGRVGRYKTGVF